MSKSEKIRLARKRALEQGIYLPELLTEEEISRFVTDPKDLESIRKADASLGVGSAGYTGIHRRLFRGDKDLPRRGPISIYSSAVEDELSFYLPDPGIRPILAALARSGYVSMEPSCEGGEKSGTPYGGVIVLDGDFVTSKDDVEEIKNIIRENTNTPFTIHRLKKNSEGEYTFQDYYSYETSLPPLVIQFKDGPVVGWRTG